MNYLVRFARFWWDFVVGDDWLVALLVVVAIGVTAAVAHSHVSAWWLMPVAVLLVRLLRRERRSVLRTAEA